MSSNSLKAEAMCPSETPCLAPVLGSPVWLHMRGAQMPARCWSEKLFVPARALPSLTCWKAQPYSRSTPLPAHHPRNGSSLAPSSGLCIISLHSSDLDSIYFAAATSHPCRSRPGVRLRQSLDGRRVPGGSVHLLTTRLLACSHWLHRGDAGRSGRAPLQGSFS